MWRSLYNTVSAKISEIIYDPSRWPVIIFVWRNYTRGLGVQQAFASVRLAKRKAAPRRPENGMFALLPNLTWLFSVGQVICVNRKLTLMQWKHSAAWTAWCPASDTDTVEGFMYLRVSRTTHCVRRRPPGHRDVWNISFWTVRPRAEIFRDTVIRP